MNRWICLFLIVIHPVFGKTYSVKLGDTKVFIKVQQYKIGNTFVHLHQNETTALKAASAIVKQQGGRLLTLVHPGQRNIVFHLHHQRFEFDPNRIFTDQGIKNTLKEFGSYNIIAHQAVNRLAQKIKSLLPKDKKIIAVHNNKAYSFKDYLPGNSLEKDARAYHHNQNHSLRNFCLVTKKQDYLRLKKMHFNSIWQALNATDDGSLSIYLSKQHYINVEAGYNELAEQIRMLKKV